MVDFSNGVPWAARPPAKVEILDPGKPAVFTIDWDLAFKHAKASLVDYEQQIDGLVEKADGLTIKTEEENVSAVETAARVKNLLKGMKDTRKRWIKGPDEYVRAVNAFVKIYRDKLEDVEKTLSRKINDFDDYREMDRRKAEAAAHRAVAAVNARLAEEAEQGGFEPVEIAAPVVPKKTGPTRTESGKAITKTFWTWECENMEQVPDKWKILDKTRINQAVNAGIREIPGLRIFEKKRTDIMSN